jgi:hypothetical protein
MCSSRPVALCKEYRAVETVRAELAQEFDDVDLILPEVRQIAEDLGRRLQALLAANTSSSGIGISFGPRKARLAQS